MDKYIKEYVVSASSCLKKKKNDRLAENTVKDNLVYDNSIVALTTGPDTMA